mmetsp:Transcript_9076/g.30066  ORF Transcript_9076/g.30066 Transcript_9076/m.30066 type:complete len:121 (-) Transcript_9076:328-690(-)
MTMTEMPAYLSNGASCLVGVTPACGGDCTGAPWLPLLYIANNILFNVNALKMMRSLGAVTSTLVFSATVPLSVLAFTLNLPFIGASPPLGPSFALGMATVVAGMLLYNLNPPLAKRRREA